MKSLFSRFRGRDSPASSSSASLPGKENMPLVRGHSPSHPSLSRQTSTPIAQTHSSSSSSESESTQPHSVEGPSGGYFDSQLSPPIVLLDGEEHSSTVRMRTTSSGEGPVKKVTFRSPAPTPTTSMVLDDIPTVEDTSTEREQRDRTNSLRSRGGSPAKGSYPHPPSRNASRSSLPGIQKPSALRRASVPVSSGSSASPTIKSTESPTPSHASFDAASTRSYLPPPNSWSEMAEEDLIQNLGPKERTRQEVLWEIVSSEERYVQELVKLNDTFCRNILPPSATSPSLTLFDPNDTLALALSPTVSPPSESPSDSFEYLPIAAKYASPNLSSSPLSATPGVARLNAYDSLIKGRPSNRTAFRQPSSNTLKGGRTHQSMPPPARSVSAQAGIGGHGNNSGSRLSYHPEHRAPGKLMKSPDGSRVSSSGSTSSTFIPGKNPLPKDLEEVLIVLAGGILEGHVKLAAALRRRYESQYPLVRSLADVFTAHSYILREYATYVLHLEKALEQVDSALSTYTTSLSRRSSRNLADTGFGRVGKLLMGLEELAAERGESGLVIALSLPFQRLLKYPLLFQNLLFNTDPSLKEYEATLAMVDDVEEIVRSIEDEKASSEENEKTRDVWARMDGLEKDKMLMTPKPNRLLISEAQCPATDGDKSTRDSSVRGKKSFRRLSDILKGSNEADFWVVRFTDVSLLCERTGLTHVPMSTFKSTSARNDSFPDLSGRSKHATMGKRASSVRPRNLYRFIKIHEWHLKPKRPESEAILAKEDISRSRSGNFGNDGPEEPVNFTRKEEQQLPSAPSTPPRSSPTKVPLKSDGGPSPLRTPRAKREADAETLLSESVSVMSFAFKGSDQIRPNPRKPTTKPLPAPSNTANRAVSAARAEKRNSGQSVTAANAKFANRLRATEESNGGDVTFRPASKARRSLPPAMLADHRNGSLHVGSPALSPTDRNAPQMSPRLNFPTPKSKETSAKVESELPPAQPTHFSRGIKGTAPPLGDMRPMASESTEFLRARIEAFEPGLSTSQSTNSAVGLWRTYRDGGAVGTPRRDVGIVSGGSRQFGGRI